MQTASSLFKSAFKDLHAGNYNQAGDKFQHLLNHNPEKSEFAYGAGCFFLKTNNPGLSEILFEKAYRDTPDFLEAGLNLGYIYYNTQRSEKARKIFKEIIKKDPKNFDGYVNLCATYVAWGEPDKAIKYAQKALEIKPGYRMANNNLSLAYLEKGEYEKGFAIYDSRPITDQVLEKRNYAHEPMKEWDGKSSGTVIVYGEQGIGDEIMFGSCLPDAMKHADIVLDAHPRLMNIWRSSFPQMNVFGTRKQKSFIWPEKIKPDYKIAIGDLCKLYRKKESDFPKEPYLKAYAPLSEKIKEKMDKGKLNIGFAWCGGIPKTNERFRKTTLEEWIPILSQDANFYSFQYQPTAEKELEEFRKLHPEINIIHDREIINDYEKTIALLDNLDLVISVPQSIIHASGAMGLETWQLTPKRSMWQMGPYGKNLPWYKNTKSFWQEKVNGWEAVFKQAGEALCDFIQNHK